jgi:hypothetical protein
MSVTGRLLVVGGGGGGGSAGGGGGVMMGIFLDIMALLLEYFITIGERLLFIHNRVGMEIKLMEVPAHHLPIILLMALR